MLKKLTINLDNEVYQALHKIVGQGNISQFVDRLVRPHLNKFPRVSVAEGRGCVAHMGRVATEEDVKRATKESARRRWAQKQK